MMIRKSIFALLMLSAWTLSAQTIDIRAAYSIGATTPYGIPATIRGMNSYTPTPSFSVGGNYEQHLGEHWGAMAGIRLVGRGMKAEAKVKQYQMSMVRGGEKLTGLFTGNVSTEVYQLAINVPLRAVFHPSEKVRLWLGPSLSVVMNSTFKGHARDGYLREGSPTGPKILIGDDDACSYDFSEDMQRMLVGIDLGVDWFFTQHFGATAEFSMGLTNIFKSDFKTIEQKMYPIYGSVGLVYQF